MAGPADVTVAGVKATLKSLRTRSGLQYDRLLATELALDVLERLPSVAALTAHGAPQADAIIRAVREAALRLPTTEMLIVDAALCLRLGSDADETDEELYDDDLSTRRESLLKHWERLHLGQGLLSVPVAPSPRALRLDREDSALSLLAVELVGEEASPPSTSEAVDVPDRDLPGGALVFGSAVWDVAFQVADIPSVNTSMQAADFVEGPGGKGLNQAVGIARLGAAAALVAPIGSDANGQEIVRYLRDESVDTSLMQVRSDAKTPRTLVISSPAGNFWHIGWKNEHEVRLTGDFLRDDQVASAISGASVIVLTLEPPRGSLRSVLRLVGENKRAPVVLTASPPIDFHEPPLSADELRRVDFLVASNWELRMLLREPAEAQEVSNQDVVNRILMAGVKTVCIVESRHCEILRVGHEVLSLPEDIRPEVISVTDPSASKDAFAAALATRLARNDGRATDDDFRFAFFAMLAAGARFGTSTALPVEAEIQRYEETLSQQAKALFPQDAR